MSRQDRSEAPMEQLRRLVASADRAESVQVEIPGEDDPLENLEELIDRARREQDGEGGKALRRLYERIDEARELPEPTAYRRPPGDPLEVLKDRMRGEWVEGDDGEEIAQRDGVDGPTGEPMRNGGTATSVGEGAVDQGQRRAMGAALSESLRGRPLPGPVRAEVASRLAMLMEKQPDAELQALWELVVFGDDRLGSGAEGR